jgi:hypothetical protein
MDGIFSGSSPTADELRFVLGLSVNVAGKTEAVVRLINNEFQPIAIQAHVKGWCKTTPNAVAPATASRTAVKAETGEAAAADPVAERRVVVVDLHLTPGSHGNKPKVVAVHSRHVSWRFALTTLSARAVLLRVLLLFFGIAGTTAMQTVNAVPPVAEVSTSFILPPLPRLTSPQLLLASLDQMVGGTFRLFTR